MNAENACVLLYVLDHYLIPRCNHTTPHNLGGAMLVNTRPRPRAVVALSALAIAMTLSSACKNLIEPCATSLVVRPDLDSVFVDSSRTFQALAMGGCGLVSTGPAAQALWHSDDTTIAQVSSTSSDGQVTVIGVRRGRAAIVATAGDLIGRAYLLVK